jgi:hypothetical protein
MLEYVATASQKMAQRSHKYNGFFDNAKNPPDPVPGAVLSRRLTRAPSAELILVGFQTARTPHPSVGHVDYIVTTLGLG